jgi:hypothetical protein
MSIRLVNKNKKRESEEQEQQEEEEMTIEEINEQQDKELEKKNLNSDLFIKYSYNFGVYFFTVTYKTIKFIINISGIYLLWILLHYVASHLYIKFCVPCTLFGFIMSPFMTATPHCQGLRWIVYNAANMINNMWIIFGAWICSTLLIINKDKPLDTSS